MRIPTCMSLIFNEVESGITTSQYRAADTYCSPLSVVASGVENPFYNKPSYLGSPSNLILVVVLQALTFYHLKRH